MRPEDRDAASIWDIVHAGHAVREFSEGFSKEQFLQDRKTHYAVIAHIEIIGEATKRLSSKFRALHPSIPWKMIAGMRDVLIHMYDDVDLGEVWKAATESIPELVAYLEPLLPPDD